MNYPLKQKRTKVQIIFKEINPGYKLYRTATNFNPFYKENLTPVLKGKSKGFVSSNHNFASWIWNIKGKRGWILVLNPQEHL